MRSYSWVFMRFKKTVNKSKMKVYYITPTFFFLYINI